jgi:serine/threonine-protein kinase
LGASTSKLKKPKNPAAETAAGPLNSAAPPAPPVEPAVPPGEVREAQDRWMRLDARASSAFSGVQQLRSQQQAQGLVIRGDILGAMNRARQFLSQAHTALDSGDLPSATAYMNGADVEIARLEKFLGR